MRFALEYLLVRAIQTAVRPLPMPAVRSCGAALGRLVHRIDAFHRRIALDNLERALGTRSEAERRDIARGMFMHFGSLLLELLKFGTLSPERVAALVDVEGEERVWQAYQQERGVLFFTGHFGYWEMHAISHPLHFRPIAVLARALDNPRLHVLLEHTRTSTGNSVIYRQGAIRKVLRELTSNRGIAILIDQHLHTPDAIYVDFFRRPAATTSALAALALRTGAPVIPVFALPLPHGRYRLIYEHAVEPPREDTADAIRDFTQRCTDVLEMYVRRHPELWLWMHRRWREQEGPVTAAPELSFDEADADA